MVRRRDAGDPGLLDELVIGDPFRAGEALVLADDATRAAWERLRTAAWRSPLREPDQAPAGAWFDGLTDFAGGFLPAAVPAFRAAQPRAYREIADEIRDLADLLEGRAWRVMTGSEVDDGQA